MTTRQHDESTSSRFARSLALKVAGVLPHWPIEEVGRCVSFAWMAMAVAFVMCVLEPSRGIILVARVIYLIVFSLSTLLAARHVQATRDPVERERELSWFLCFSVMAGFAFLRVCVGIIRFCYG